MLRSNISREQQTNKQTNKSENGKESLKKVKLLSENIKVPLQDRIKILRQS